MELFYVDDKKGSVFSFMEKLRARAYCVNMFLKELTFTLWEDDVKGGGHNTNNKPIDTLKARVDKNGVAVVEFPLSKAMMKKAMEGEVDVKQLEFYVTVEYYKNKKHATKNVDVDNPNPKVPINPPKKTEPKQPPKAKGSPAENKPKSKKEEKGILDKIEEKWDELWDWWEIPGTIKKEQPPTVQKPKGRSPAVVKEPPLQKIEESKKGDCFCNRDFTPEEFTKIIHDLRDSETGVKRDSGYNLFAAYNCPLPISDRTIEKLRNKINNLFREYDINTCIRKIHFLAQVYHETDRFRTTLEYATKKSYKPYFGRGLMQLTWESNYKIYKHYSGVDCISNYGQIASNFDLVCDSAGWYWKQGKVLSVGRRWRGPSDAPTYVKAQNPDYPKTTITWNDGDDKIKKYGTVNLGLIADDDKVDLISYLVNGGANGLQERRNYVFTLKSIFKYPQECVNKKTSKNETSSTPNDKVTIRLVRKWETSNSTIGEFTIDNTDIKGYFLEEKGPDTTVSGIEQRVPIGTYNLEWHSGSKIKKGLKLYNDVVSKSRAILIHSGNTANDTEGCLIAGSSKSKDFVGGSRAKLKEIFDYVEEIGIEGSKIIITQAYE
ncbi:DUF5675 family protein [Chryseobacterium taklimakanense]|uniref:DUF5675 family protein n=1 Tax=Chryseobacterium taklimakanense TaxID=536441 RepID=UPI0012FE1C49|nr:DUF5675 family protein [Chryseobacterium taklimakanense]